MFNLVCHVIILLRHNKKIKKQAVCCRTLLLPSAESQYFPLQSRSSLPTSGTPAEKQEAASAVIVLAININAPAVNIFPTSLVGLTLISGQKL